MGMCCVRQKAPYESVLTEDDSIRKTIDHTASIIPFENLEKDETSSSLTTTDNSAKQESDKETLDNETANKMENEQMEEGLNKGDGETLKEIEKNAEESKKRESIDGTNEEGQDVEDDTEAKPDDANYENSNNKDDNEEEISEGDDDPE
eukprot:GHVL01024452.1.p3 GENE.GHVL01024452.1~~GHVL01024452.1.p3  ORF type:complete len:149 (+),score=46.45 GHVL01024452.1:47-493(+)